MKKEARPTQTLSSFFTGVDQKFRPRPAPPHGAAPTLGFCANSLTARPLFSAVAKRLYAKVHRMDAMSVWTSAARNSAGLLLNADVLPLLSWSAQVLRSPGMWEAVTDHLRLRPCCPFRWDANAMICLPFGGLRAHATRVATCMRRNALRNGIPCNDTECLQSGLD